MTGKEKYYKREEELSKIGYYAVLFMREYLEAEPVKAKELCESLIKTNLDKHGHSEQAKEIIDLIDIDHLKLATKRFAFRSFDEPKIWAEKHRIEQERKEKARQKEREEVKARVEAFKKKKVIVRGKKWNRQKK